MKAVEDDIAFWLPRVRPDFGGRILALVGYFDDTDLHTDKGKTFSAVAGVLFEIEGAQEFAKAWAKICPPLEKPFRTAACAAGRGQFAGWGKERCNALLDELAHLVADLRGPAIVASGIFTSEFDKFLAGYANQRPFVANPFTLNLFNSMRILRDWAESAGSSELIEYIFEAGSAGEKDAAEFIRRAYRIPQLRERFRIAGYAFQPKDNASALIAADFVAWEMQHNARREKGWSERMQIIARDKSRPFYRHSLSAESMTMWAMHNSFYRLEADLPEDYPDAD